MLRKTRWCGANPSSPGTTGEPWLGVHFSIVRRGGCGLPGDIERFAFAANVTTAGRVPALPKPSIRFRCFIEHMNSVFRVAG